LGAKGPKLDPHHSRPRSAHSNLLRQFSALDFPRTASLKIFLPHQISAHAFEIGQPPVPRHNLFAQSLVELLVLFQSHHQHQHLVTESLLWP